MNKTSQLNYNGTKVLAKYPMGVYNTYKIRDKEENVNGVLPEKNPK